MGYNYYDNYSSVIGSHYPTKQAKEQMEAWYFKNLKLKELEELKKIRQNMQTEIPRYNLNDYDIDLECDMDYSQMDFNSIAEFKEYVKKDLKRHQAELKDYQYTLQDLKEIEMRYKQLNELKQEGFFKYLFKAGKIKRRFNSLCNKHMINYENKTDFKAFKTDITNGIKIWKDKIKKDKEIIANIKES